MRTVPEWIGATDDAAIPKAVKLRIWAREDGRCYLTGLRINALKDTYEFEHVIALANGGEHRESNIRLALTEVHKLKTKADAGVTAKIRRTRSRHLGITRAKGSLTHPTLKRTMDGRVVAR